MSGITIFFLVLAVLGYIDKFIGGKFGISESFTKGFSLIPDFIIFMAGIYCIGPAVVALNQATINAATSDWFFDPSIIPGCLLATDMGAYPIADALANNDNIGLYSGVCLGGSLGTLISFCLPVYIAGVSKDDGEKLIKGFIYGIIVLPVTMIISGFMMGIPAALLFSNLSPVLLFSILILIGLIKVPKLTSKFLLILGTCVKAVAYVSSAVMLFGIFFPEHAFVDKETSYGCIVMVVKMGITVAGALVAMDIFRKVFKKPIEKLSVKMGINEYSIMGMIIGLPAGVAMLPIVSRMDNKGKILNGAFAVSAHYTLGGQMALISSNEPVNILLIFFFIKLTGGILALALAYLMEKKEIEE